MKVFIPAFILQLLFSITTASQQPNFRIETFIKSSGSIESSKEVLYCFGGEKTDFILKISGQCEQTFTFKIQLRQMSGALAVPMGTVYELSSKTMLDETGSYASSFQLILPDVKRVSKFELQYFYRINPIDPWIASGSAILNVYPHDILNPLHSLADKCIFLVVDPSGNLNNFFKENDIPCVNENEHSIKGYNNKNKPVIAMFVVPNKEDTNDSDQDDKIEVFKKITDKIIVFEETSKGLPSIFIKKDDEGTWVEVKMKFIHSLSSNPRAQETFMEILSYVTSDLN